MERQQPCADPRRSDSPTLQRKGVREQVRAGKKDVLGQRVVPAKADAMSSLAARSFAASASVMRPTSPYLKVPPLAHSTTSPMACFLAVATRRAAVRNSLRSWLNPELPADPLPLLFAGGEAVLSVGPLADPLPPARVGLFSGGEGFHVGCGAFNVQRVILSRDHQTASLALRAPLQNAQEGGRGITLVSSTSELR